MTKDEVLSYLNGSLTSKWDDSYGSRKIIESLENYNPNRKQIIEAIKEFGEDLLSQLNVGSLKYGFEHSLMELVAIMDVLAPPELKQLADRIFEASLPTNYACHGVRAIMGYYQEKRHIPMWREYLKFPKICAYAFSSLLQIDPTQPDLLAILDSLDEQHINKDFFRDKL